MADRGFDSRPREVIGKVTRTKQDLEAYGGDVARGPYYLRSEEVTIIYQKRISNTDAAKQISDKAWARMIRARQRDFS